MINFADIKDEVFAVTMLDASDISNQCKYFELNGIKRLDGSSPMNMLYTLRDMLESGTLDMYLFIIDRRIIHTGVISIISYLKVPYDIVAVYDASYEINGMLYYSGGHTKINKKEEISDRWIETLQKIFISRSSESAQSCILSKSVLSELNDYVVSGCKDENKLKQIRSHIWNSIINEEINMLTKKYSH